ncbi:hypothetical protein KO507_05245 [Gilvimarinus agarilyticus]|uniref:hypothetical protein n=1 Tax=Gilvimarinus sp. 2_MG-2023 TaxID=3062666 RepID=UPI001C080DA8|nr:hypothetical protein [Gilvimarinus sp. 2_MG-2023]MBU2885166.1 hypothetical protein [Gilvimarinus agarilyticus]MDO6570064.1 hypothetical protein [Gilvimarinus sp. 2_MG-2023]
MKQNNKKSAFNIVSVLILLLAVVVGLQLAGWLPAFSLTEPKENPAVAQQSTPSAVTVSTPTSEAASPVLVVPESSSSETIVPRIALYPLDDTLYSQKNSDGPELSELITSLLLIELGSSSQVELLDRSFMDALFYEKTAPLAGDQARENQQSVMKLPLSDYSLVGSLLSGEEGEAYTLKLLDNSTGEVVSAARFPFTIATLRQVVRKASTFVQTQASRVKPKRGTAESEQARRKIAIGHFFDVTVDDKNLAKGRDLSEHLIERLVNDMSYRVLARTQVMPLVIEEGLRKLQYTEEDRSSLRAEADWAVHGVYRVETTRLESLITLYLYIDSVDSGRELFVLKGNDWAEIYNQTSETIITSLSPVEAGVATDDQSKSRELLFQAADLQGVVATKHVRNGTHRISHKFYTELAKQPVKNQVNTSVRLLEEALEYDPLNYAAKFSLSLILDDEQGGTRAKKLNIDVLGGIDSETIYSAESINRDKSIDEYFGSTVNRNVRDKIQKALIDNGLLDQSNNVIKKIKYNLDYIFNRPYSNPIEGLDLDETVQALEYLRLKYHQPGYKIRFSPPRNGHYSIAQKRSWYQAYYNVGHNREAMLNTSLAVAASGMDVLYATDLPSVEFYPETAEQSPQRRRSRMRIAVDGFASSVFLDEAYLKPRVMLGYSLCRPEVGLCGLGEKMLSWAVDQIPGADGEGPMGLFEDDEVNEHDRLMFLAADVVDRVDEASFTRIFQNVLRKSNYLFNKKKEQKSKLQKNQEEANYKEPEKTQIYSYVDLIRVESEQLERNHRKLKRNKNYSKNRESLALFLASQNSAELNRLSNNLLKEVLHDFPSVYPYLLFNADPVTSAVMDEQDRVMAKIAAGEVNPVRPSKLMGRALALFRYRAEQGSPESFIRAKKYISYFEEYYGITENSAIDFSWLYHHAGEHEKSRAILQGYGKSSFELKNYKWDNYNGVYTQNGFDKESRLIYTNTRTDIKITYTAHHRLVDVGEHPLKWRRGPYALPEDGDFIWGEMSPEIAKKVAIDRAEPLDPWAGIPVVEIEALPEAVSSGDKNTTESLLFDKYSISPGGDVAIKGFPRRSGIGPLRNKYFSEYLRHTQDVEIIRAALFRKGYLSVEGFPVDMPGVTRLDKLQEDFPDFNYREMNDLSAALSRAERVSFSGEVSIYQYVAGAWVEAATLSASDATTDANFGVGVSAQGGRALVCNTLEGIYSYLFINSQWQWSRKFNAGCSNVAVSGDWAVVSWREKVYMFHFDGQLWQPTQTLVVDDYFSKRERRENFEVLGASMVIMGNEMFIGNPRGGSDHLGEVYRFVLGQDEWRQTDTLAPDIETVDRPNSSFGDSLAVSRDWLAVGNRAKGEVDTPNFRRGMVYLYKRENKKWTPFVRLIGKDTTIQDEFGRSVFIDKKNNTLLIKSNNSLYRYVL